MPNRLAAEKSPYLRQHADNPVDWYPWGGEALAKARTEQKPIFLSIGYSTCHWCHVMAHESFENDAVAAVLNRDFVPVKVDREERPDLDRVYMTYVQQTTGHGGWPMSVWLTPDGKPFYGGTYFAPDDRHGRPGFVAVLNAITRHWNDDRKKISDGAEEVVQALRRYAAEGGPAEISDASAKSAQPLHEAAGDAFEKCYQYFYESHDAQWGGFGGAPKFPRASVINFLFRIAALQGALSELGLSAIKMAEHTLQRMAEGGLHDHVGGGFHRYAVDEQWFVPHFEKMLYDQAQIALNYLEARQAGGREVFAWLARDIFDYVQRDLTGPHGGFYSAEDADSPLSPEKSDQDQGTSGRKLEHAEGAFYVWSKDEIDTFLGEDSDFFCAHYGVRKEGNVQHDPQGEFTGKNILMQRQSLVMTARAFDLDIELASQKLLDALGKLRAVRALRPRPHLDDKVITAWNALMISALARAHQVLGENGSRGDGAAGEPGSRYLAMAVRSAEFIERELYDSTSGILYRSWRDGRSQIAGFAEDYAYLVQGLIDLYEAGFDVRWLQWAVKLQEKMDELFWDAEDGGYFNSRADDPTVIVRLKEDYDGAEPAPNSIALMNLMRWDAMLGLKGTREKALRVIGAMERQWHRAPQALPQLLCGFELALTEPRTVVIAGDPDSADFKALVAVLHERLSLRRSLLAIDPSFNGDVGRQWLAAHRSYLAEMKPVDGKATAYVCENFTCKPPVIQPADLRDLLAQT